ncbi:efflux RND transporter periplasmic adaptor subunit [Lichenicoccus sp.]|uniref:efflux RND transporter periplasmic adaptor subunit n=1 Tax=Lichenicoccus sp. TaxID=2781899 RepID=UPI003D0FB953
MRPVQALWVAVPLALLIGWGGFNHWQQSRAADDTQHAEASFIPDVHVATAKRSLDNHPITLPGQTVAFDAADLYARATGYIAERRVDIGSKVHKGDLLLRIAAPDLDAQLSQARAQLGQMEAALLQAQATLDEARSNDKLGKLNKYRATTLASQGWGTRQDADTQTTNSSVQEKSVASAQAGIGVAAANIRAQQATIDRLVALTGFERVVAPFDGVITARQVDIGDLVQSDSSSGTALLHIDRDDILRCQVYVPQSQFPGMHDGVRAEIRVPELPNRVFSGTITRTSTSLAQNSRSLLVEVDIPNPDETLTAGLYVDMLFQLERPEPVVMIPDSALIFDTASLRVAVLQADGTVKLTPITLARDLGEQAEVAHGLSGGERLVINPPSELEDGQHVHALSGKTGGGGGATAKTAAG